MDTMAVMQARHSIRKYTDQRITETTGKELQDLITACNEESGLHIQLCLDEPNAFNSLLAHYGRFRNVRNYLALIGKKSETLDERIGYYGEKIVLKAAECGLSSCWVGLTYKKSSCAAQIAPDEELVCVVSLGYPAETVSPHKSKKPEDVSHVSGTVPNWFKNGVDAALLAPTALNQQKFRFALEGNIVSATPGRGFYTHVDLGIAKYHFELGAGKENFSWK